MTRVASSPIEIKNNQFKSKQAQKGTLPPFDDVIYSDDNSTNFEEYLSPRVVNRQPLLNHLAIHKGDYIEGRRRAKYKLRTLNFWK